MSIIEEAPSKLKELSQNAVIFEKIIDFWTLRGKATKAYQIRYVEEL